MSTVYKVLVDGVTMAMKLTETRYMSRPDVLEHYACIEMCEMLDSPYLVKFIGHCLPGAGSTSPLSGSGKDAAKLDDGGSPAKSCSESTVAQPNSPAKSPTVSLIFMELMDR